MASVRVLVCALLATGVAVLATPAVPGWAADNADGVLARRLHAVVRRGPRTGEATTAERPAATQPDGTPAAAQVVADGLDGLDGDDLGRKKKIKKSNATVGEEVLTAIVDGFAGETEDAAFGSEIRKELGYLVQAVTKLGSTAITQLVTGGPAPAAVSTATRAVAVKCEPQAEGCSDGEGHAGRHAADRSARAVDNVGEGRKRQVRRLLVRYLVLLKVFALGIILPGAVLLSLLQSWKAVTLSLMALLLAGVIGLRGLVSTAAKGQPAEVIHTGPGGHYWRRVSQEQGQEPDRLAYGAYAPLN